MPTEHNRRHWSRYGGKRKRLLNRLMKRDRGRCRYCQVEVQRGDGTAPHPPNMATIEHYPLPKSKLPVESWFDMERVILACYACNHRQDKLGDLVPMPGGNADA